MPDDDQRRRASDQVLPLIIQRLDRQDALSDEWRRNTDTKHATMLSKLESLPLLAAKVEAHDKWIEGEGKNAVNSISKAKWVGGALAIGGGAAGGSIVHKILVALGIGGGN